MELLLADEASTDVRLQNLQKKCNAPLPIALLFDYINETARSERSKTTSVLSTFAQIEGLANRHEFFLPGWSVFKFPPDTSETPSPYYHSIEGEDFVSLDWEDVSPDCR
jgi:hypothetical protein